MSRPVVLQALTLAEAVELVPKKGAKCRDVEIVVDDTKRARRLVLSFKGPKTKQACKVCGCTRHSACFSGCSWMTRRPMLCSSCFSFLMNIRERQLFGLTVNLFELTRHTALLRRCWERAQRGREERDGA